MHEADRAAVLDHDQRRDLRGFLDFERGRQQVVGRDRARLAGHDRRDGQRAEIGPQIAAQVAVGDDAGERAVRVHDDHRAEALAADLVDRLVHQRVDAHDRQPLVLVHDVAHELEPGAELAARMEDAEMLGREAALFQKRDRPARRRGPAAWWWRSWAQGRSGRPRRPSAGRGRPSAACPSVDAALDVRAISGTRKRLE